MEKCYFTVREYCGNCLACRSSFHRYPASEKEILVFRRNATKLKIIAKIVVHLIRSKNNFKGLAIVLR